jgi:hypothetical protein
MILLPDLSKTNFISFEADLSVDLEDNQRNAFAGKERHLRGVDCESFSNEHYFLSLDVEVQGDLRVKIKMEYTTLFCEGGFDPKEWDRLTAAEIQKRIQALAGQEPDIYTKCGFRVDVDQLPERGVVRRGIGVRAQFHEDELRLAGAQFAINGDMENTISWFVETDEDDWGSVLGSVFLRTKRVLDSNVFSEIVEPSQRQFERYILEKDFVAYR